MEDQDLQTWGEQINQRAGGRQDFGAQQEVAVSP